MSKKKVKKKKRSKKPKLRIPVAPPTLIHKDANRYDRKDQPSIGDALDEYTENNEWDNYFDYEDDSYEDSY